MSELDKKSTFYNKIEDNSHICDNCYRRLRFVLKPHESMPDVVGNKMEYTNEAHFAYFGDEQETGRPSRKKSYCECGNVDDAKIRPLDNRKVMEIAQRIDERLCEEDIEIDEEAFYSYIREKREGSDIHFNEEKFFEKAIELSEI